ncbi:hypothetical protein JAAARDRAFT_194315 [Jaapia argillacea MUCL 33604]|uniref:Uncharacterized protein n=1 Tax=Jaapia argillacea MUCL 33604 TaxID=933084 RepID=A0A067Q0X4_9AGAM|nr:hypothetical protein JAAARDRAFT_194315 [Jaapia argillacea MUCL 33604]
MFWASCSHSCKSVLIDVMCNLVDLDRYHGLHSSSEDVVLCTMTEIVYQGNYALARLSALLGVQVIKSDMTAACAGLTLYALLLKSAVHNPPLNIARVRINTIGIPIFAALEAIPKLGLIVAVALELGYATPRPSTAFTVMFAVVTATFLGLVAWEYSVVQSNMNTARDVEGGTAPT